MKSILPIPSVGVLALLVPRGIDAATILGTVPVTVQSNETLRMITEYNHTNSYVRYHQALQDTAEANRLLSSLLLLEFDVCFPDYYCPKAEANLDAFRSTFDDHICGEYCDDVTYQHTLEILSVCQPGSGSISYQGSGCVDFGLTIQASDTSEADAIRIELGARLGSSKSTWRALLHEIAPEFGSGVTAGQPDVLGYHIDEGRNGTWYPAWDDGHELCRNDENVPFYMRLDPGEYLAPTMTDCCRKHYWWNVRGCAEPQNRPCPEGYVPTPEQIAREGIMSGHYYGSYPNIFYAGCIPADATNSNNRHLEKVEKRSKAEDDRRRALRILEQENKLAALVQRQRRLEKLMPPSSQRPPVHTEWEPQRLR